MKQQLKKLSEIDWRRNAAHWYLRTIRANGRMISSETAVLLTANIIKQAIGIPLNRDEALREEKFVKSVKK